MKSVAVLTLLIEANISRIFAVDINLFVVSHFYRKRRNSGKSKGKNFELNFCKKIDFVDLWSADLF